MTVQRWPIPWFLRVGLVALAGLADVLDMAVLGSSTSRAKVFHFVPRSICRQRDS